MECNCNQSNIHLHVEIENLKQRLLERERHIVNMETDVFKEAEKYPNGEFAAIKDQLFTWQEKYSRLHEAHRRVQKVNQGLEDKLLKMVDRTETEKTSLYTDITMLTEKLMDVESTNEKLTEENIRFRNDLNVAIQLLQCKPSNFVEQRIDTLPSDLQIKVKSYVMSNKPQRKYSDSVSPTLKNDAKVIKVPIPTFPPTAMVFSVGQDKDQNRDDKVEVEEPAKEVVSTAIVAKILKDRQRERTLRHCQTCSCFGQQLCTKSTQTGPCSDEWTKTDLIDLFADSRPDTKKRFRNVNILDESESRIDASRCSIRMESDHIILDGDGTTGPIMYKRRFSNADSNVEPIVHGKVSSSKKDRAKFGMVIDL